MAARPERTDAPNKQHALIELMLQYKQHALIELMLQYKQYALKGQKLLAQGTTLGY